MSVKRTTSHSASACTFCNRGRKKTYSGIEWRNGFQMKEGLSASHLLHVTASSWSGGGGGPKHVSRTLKSKNNASRRLKFRAHISRLFSKIHFVFIVVVYRVCFLLCSLLRTFLTEFYFKYRGS